MTDESREFWECFIKKNISYKYKWWVHDPDRRVTSISEYALWKKKVNLKHKWWVQDSLRQDTSISENAL